MMNDINLDNIKVKIQEKLCSRGFLPEIPAIFDSIGGCTTLDYQNWFSEEIIVESIFRKILNHSIHGWCLIESVVLDDKAIVVRFKYQSARF